MTSKEKILVAVLENQPALTPRPDIGIFKGDYENVVQTFVDTFTTIGGRVFPAESMSDVKGLIHDYFDPGNGCTWPNNNDNFFTEKIDQP